MFSCCLNRTLASNSLGKYCSVPFIDESEKKKGLQYHGNSTRWPVLYCVSHFLAKEMTSPDSEMTKNRPKLWNGGLMNGRAKT